MSILELREADSATTQGNGDWSCQLAEPVTISDGDTLVMRQCFLDTRNQAAGKITLEDDLQCIVAGGLYLQDWLPTGVSTGVFSVPGPTPTNQPYLLMKEYPAGLFAGMTYYKSQKFEFNNSGGDHWGDLTIGYSYIDVNSASTYTQVYLPRINTDKDFYELDLNFIANTALSPVTIMNPPSEFSKAKALIKGYTTEPVTKDTFLYEKRSMEFTIPAGIYEPTDLATRITNILSVNTQTYFPTVPVASPWLVALSDFQSGGTSQPLVNYDCTNIVTYPSTSDYYVGASQMSLIWDDATQRFGFSYLHTPLYDSAGDIVTSFVKQEQNFITGDSVVCTRNGGVFLTALLPASFWFGTLQLKPTIISQIILQDIVIGTFTGQADRIYPSLVDGVNSTTAFVGIDAAIEKSADFYKVPTIPNPPAMLNTIAQNTTEIWGSEIQDTSSSSHFLLDITGCGRTSVIGKQSRCEIRGVIGSYYSEGGFTQGDSSGAISYTHEGEPFQIQGLSVRVLQPDGSSASSVLGNQSCVFLELIKASPQPPVKK